MDATVVGPSIHPSARYTTSTDMTDCQAPGQLTRGICEFTM